MAFGTVGFACLGEHLFAVVADPAMFILAVRIFCHLQIFLFHFEDFGVAVGAFELLLGYMVLMTEQDRAGAPFCFKFNVPAARFFLLGRGDPKSRKAQDADADE